MLSKALGRLEPKLIRIYRRLADAPAPNLRGDRDIEYSWVVANIPEGLGEALEFGCGNSWLALVAARRGFKTTAIDLTPLEWFYVHPSLRLVQADIFGLDAAPCSFDLIINCSSIEHVGLGRYGDSLNAHGDLAAMERLRILLKPGGVMLLTIPVGRDATFAPLHRIYGAKRLPALLSGFTVEEKEYWTKDPQNRWVLASEKDALAQQPTASLYALGCFVLRAPSDVRSNG